ncbi:uncharacterized protein LOC135389610 [Ornithodoros turicata]|uniref:uncharacterized protein LOC135389610 n=1 Tax=Ornithodoros turicata TaxID=34597 RepID=UPI003139E42E
METDYMKLTGEEDLLTDNNIYQQAVGKLLYLSTTTRPDIAFTIGILRRRVSKPRTRDWNAVKRVFRYLKHTRDFKLKLSADTEMKLVCFVDTDWAGNLSDRKSTSGYFIQLGGSPIAWSTKKRLTVALSSTEVEYVSAVYASQEVVWLQELLHGFGHSECEPTCIYEDNQSCIKLALGEGLSARTKHIDVRHHYLRDVIHRGLVDMQYCQSAEMIADVLTKPLPRQRLETFRGCLGLVKGGLS